MAACDRTVEAGDNERGDIVLALASVQKICTVIPTEYIFRAGPAKQLVVADAPDQAISIASTTRNPIVSELRVNEIDATLAVKLVVATASDYSVRSYAGPDSIAPVTAFDLIGARASRDPVAPSITKNPIVAASGADSVVPSASPDRVVASPREDHIGPGAAIHVSLSGSHYNR